MIKRNARVFALFTILVIIGLSLAPAWAAGSSFEVTDDLGRVVTVTGNPHRIVSLAPSNTEILFALGLGKRVAGVDSYSNYPEDALKLPKIGGFSEPSIETIASLEPDLVLATGMHAKFLPQLETLGIPVVVLDAKSVDGVIRDIRLVSSIAGASAEAETLISEITAVINDVRAKSSTHERVRVYYEVFSDPLISIGPNTLISELITIAGGESITADSPADYPIISSETVISANPEVIIFPEFHGTGSLSVESFQSRVGWDHIEAVQNGRIYPINADIISRAGPRIAQAAQLLFEIMHQ